MLLCLQLFAIEVLGLTDPLIFGAVPVKLSTKAALARIGVVTLETNEKVTVCALMHVDNF